MICWDCQFIKRDRDSGIYYCTNDDRDREVDDEEELPEDECKYYCSKADAKYACVEGL